VREKKLVSKIAKFPKKPGIYFFKNDKNEVIYIGKARSLRERVKSYFLSTSDYKINNILAETTDIDYILTDSEKEATFLENNFVQQYQPKFNLRLKDDKSFPYLKLTLQERYPGISFTRKVEEDSAKYFGPFSPAHQARKTIHLINKYFGVRACEENIPGKRKRPCLEYELNLCSAPCVGAVSESDYRERAENALLFLEGKTEQLVNNLRRKMKEAADRQEYELAAQLRDAIRTVEDIRNRPRLISTSLEDMDIIGFATEKKNVAFYLFFMRKGKVLESKEIFQDVTEGTPNSEILFSLLKNFYQNQKNRPSQILLPFEPVRKEELSRIFSEGEGKKTKLVIPLRGKNKQLVEFARRNAEILLEKNLVELNPLFELKNLLGLKTLPSHIEGFDISNVGGKESVGSLVAFENGKSKKDKYRKYKIKTVEGPNDIASLAEVIRRRYTRLLKEKIPLPDLIMVDGGKGQLHAALSALGNLGISHLPVISLAKKEELIFTTSSKEGIRLDRTSSALKLIQSIRDEAHRFAITFHRQRREKRSFESYLDHIPGLGEKRKRALLAQYKSIQEIKKAAPEELAKIVGTKTAEELLKNI
jgi:excinuclease ABC subunit C